ncbi:MAG TPA: hypothetical protein VIV12_18880, partial [Streptosporangiaceae bacterium]
LRGSLPRGLRLGGASGLTSPARAGEAAQLGQGQMQLSPGGLAAGLGQEPRRQQPLTALVLILHRDLRHATLTLPV